MSLEIPQNDTSATNTEAVVFDAGKSVVQSTERRPIMYCSWCGAENQEGNTYCLKCGKNLRTGAPPAKKTKSRRWIGVVVLGAGAILIALVVYLVVKAIIPPAPQPIALVDPDGNVVTILPDGSNPTELARDGNLASYGLAQWAPDHRWLAALRVDKNGETNLWLNSVSGDREQLIDISMRGYGYGYGYGSGLYGSRWFAWSPDSRYLAFCGDPTQGIMIVDTRGNVQTISIEGITVNQGRSYCLPWWSPDSQKLAVIGIDTDSISHVVVADVRRQEAQSVADSGNYDDFLGVFWTPDGRWLVATVYNHDTNAMSLYELRPDGSDQQVFSVPEAEAVVVQALFSPRGNKLAYVTSKRSSNEIRLYVSKADGSEAEQVTEKSLYPLEWSSDGSLLLLFDASNGTGWYYYDTRTKEVTSISDVADMPLAGCTFAPLGDSLACGTQSKQIVLVDPNNGAATVIAEGVLQDW